MREGAVGGWDSWDEWDAVGGAAGGTAAGQTLGGDVGARDEGRGTRDALAGAGWV